MTTWTKIKPTEPGYYWYFSLIPEKEYRYPQIVQVADWNGDLSVRHIWDEEDGNIEAYSGYWFGPLNQPDHPEYMIYSK